MKKFLAGFAVACLLEPTSTVIAYLAEWAKSAISVKITQNNVTIQNLTPQQEEQIHTPVIGFQIPSEEEGDYEDEDEE